LEIELRNNRLQRPNAETGILLIDHVADPVEQPSQGNFREEVPELITSCRILVILLFEPARKLSGLFELDDPRMWEIKLCQQITFEEKSVPIDTDAKFLGLRRDTARAAEKKLQLNADVGK
jgi:hypothetical protein